MDGSIVVACRRCDHDQEARRERALEEYEERRALDRKVVQ